MARFFATALILSASVFMAVPLKKAAASSPCVDVALVLTLDASASVSREEFDLQQKGIASAFRNHDVLNALSMAGRVAVAAVIWGSEGLPKQQTAWTVIESDADAESFARTVESIPRLVTGDTGLGAGLDVAVQKLVSLNGCAVRKIINVSGDGMETPGRRGHRKSLVPSQVKALAKSLDIEINALAISNEDRDLASYYARDVITGPDAFVMDVRNYQDIATALRRKLVREISPQKVAGHIEPVHAD